MKKNFKKVAIAMFIAICSVCCVLFAACSPSGTYKFSSFTASVLGISTTINAGDELLGTTISADSVTITLNSDGTGTSNLLGDGTTFTYSAVEGENNVYKTSTGIEMTISGGSIVFEGTLLGVTGTIILKK